LFVVFSLAILIALMYASISQNGVRWH